MRGRFIRPEYFNDEDISSLDFPIRIFYIGLWCVADREGRLRDRPGNLKAQILPYDNINPEEFLTILARPKKFNGGDPFIVRYEVAGERYIQILKFLEYQKPHHTEKRSTIPPIPSV